MAMNRSGPPVFRAWSPPKRAEIVKQAETRNSPRERGYDARWDRISRAFRRQNPFCLFCSQENLDGLTEVTDHALPAADFPELRYEPSNFVPLCKHHHDGMKARMEVFARRTGQLERLRNWCFSPKTRPKRF
jgi:5-methylcytosine-specific restriction endonuclease McrA